MKKIPTLFERDYGQKPHLVYDEVTPGCEWVLRGEGWATRKLDGTCCLIRNGKLYKRYELKPGKTPPDGFEAAQEPDPVTGEQPGWVPVEDGPEDKYHREAWARLAHAKEGTYELVGPKINGNRDNFPDHILIAHSDEALKFAYSPELHFESIRILLKSTLIEGIVWHHEDGRMTKIKRRDFGFSWD